MDKVELWNCVLRVDVRRIKWKLFWTLLHWLIIIQHCESSFLFLEWRECAIFVSSFCLHVRCLPCAVRFFHLLCLSMGLEWYIEFALHRKSNNTFAKGSKQLIKFLLNAYWKYDTAKTLFQQRYIITYENVSHGKMTCFKDVAIDAIVETTTYAKLTREKWKPSDLRKTLKCDFQYVYKIWKYLGNEMICKQIPYTGVGEGGGQTMNDDHSLNSSQQNFHWKWKFNFCVCCYPSSILYYKQGK